MCVQACVPGVWGNGEDEIIMGVSYYNIRIAEG